MGTYQALSVSSNGGQHRGSNLLHDALDFGDLVLQRDILVHGLLGVSVGATDQRWAVPNTWENATCSSFPILIVVVWNVRKAVIGVEERRRVRRDTMDSISSKRAAYGQSRVREETYIPATSHSSHASARRGVTSPLRCMYSHRALVARRGTAIWATLSISASILLVIPDSCESCSIPYNDVLGP